VLHAAVASDDPVSSSHYGGGDSEPVSELQRYQTEYFMWRAYCKFLEILILRCITTDNDFLVRRIGDFPGTNPRGAWLPDDDQYQAAVSTPRANQRARPIAQEQEPSTMEARMTALERRLYSMESAHDRRRSGEHRGFMAHRGDGTFTPQVTMPSQSPPQASSVATSATSALPVYREDWLPSRTLTPMSSENPLNTPTQSPQRLRAGVNHPDLGDSQ
jgi:hypothetical protein